MNNKLMKTKLIPLLTVCAVFWASAVQAQIAYDFNAGQADYNANFTSTAGGTFYQTGWQATGGVSNGGSMNTNGTQQTGFYTAANAGQFTTNGDTKFVSMYFLAGTLTSNNFDGRASVGFGTDSTVNIGSGSFVSGTVATTANDGTNGTNYALRVNYRNGGGGANTVDANMGNLITNNEWYQLRLDLNYIGSNAYTATVNLFSWGADGVTGGGLVDTFGTGTLNASSGGNLSTITNTNLFAGFMGADSNAGLRALQVDNFSATVPEPSTYALLASGLVALAFLRRRKKSV